MSTQTGRRVAISAGSLAVLLGALDAYVVVTIMRDIMNDVGIPVNQLQRITWIVTMYLLGYIAAMPLLGRASDRFGRKLLLQVSLALSSSARWSPRCRCRSASGACSATTPTTAFHVLIVGRTIQGVASGALLPVTLALGADLGRSATAPACSAVSAPRRSSAACWARCTGSSSSGCSTTGDDVFWINVPLTLIAMAMIQFSLPGHDRSAEPEESTWSAVCCWRSLWASRWWGCTTPIPTASRCCRATGRRW